MAAKELVSNLQKRNFLGHIFKVDFSKAFHMKEWDLLMETLSTRVMEAVGLIGLLPNLTPTKLIY